MDNDDALAARLAGDLDGTFPELVEAHQDRLYSIAIRSLGDARDAEEVAQDALVRAYRAMGGYSPERVASLRLRPWLAAIAVNLARNKRRRHDDRQPPAALEPLLAEGFEPRDERTPEPATVAARREGVTELATALLRLPPAVRIAIVLRHVDGLSVAETAEALGRPEGTVKAQVSRGLERLAAILAETNSLTSAASSATPTLPGSPIRTQQGRSLATAEVLS